MGFFDKLKLLNKKSGFVVTYEDKTLLTINPDTLKKIVGDNISAKFAQHLYIKPNKTEEKNRKLNTDAIKLIVAYNSARKEFYGGRKIKDVTSKDASFKHFVKASETIRDHKTTPSKFMKSQVDGLAFVNDGAGTFPKPSQLVTLLAEERLLKAIQTHSAKNVVEDVVRLQLNRSDKETELMQNPNFTSKYDKLKNKTATLQDAYFVYDCMLARKGRVTSFVDEAVTKLEVTSD